LLLLGLEEVPANVHAIQDNIDDIEDQESCQQIARFNAAIIVELRTRIYHLC
jgi:hypothetical protein